MEQQHLLFTLMGQYCIDLLSLMLKEKFLFCAIVSLCFLIFFEFILKKLQSLRRDLTCTFEKNADL